MNRLILLAACIIVIIGAYLLVSPRPSEKQKATPIPSHTNDWHVYNSSSGDFSVSLPVRPVHATGSDQDIMTQQVRRYEMYVAESDKGAIYMINTVTYPSTLSDDQAVFQRFIGDMLTSNPRNKLVNSHHTQFQNHDALNFTIENDRGTLESLMFVRGHTLYVLTHEGKPGTPQDKEDFQRFVSSFSVNEKNENK